MSSSNDNYRVSDVFRGRASGGVSALVCSCSGNIVWIRETVLAAFANWGSMV